MHEAGAASERGAPVRGHRHPDQALSHPRTGRWRGHVRLHHEVSASGRENRGVGGVGVASGAVWLGLEWLRAGALERTFVLRLLCGLYDLVFFLVIYVVYSCSASFYFLS